MKRIRIRKSKSYLQKKKFVLGMANKMKRKMTWPEREFATKPEDNYTLMELQAEILSNSEFINKNYTVGKSSSLSIEKELLNELTLENKKYISTKEVPKVYKAITHCNLSYI